MDRTISSSMDDSSNSWQCSDCTYRNSNQSFRCHMCGVLKRSSTRSLPNKPEMVGQQQQQIRQQAIKTVETKDKSEKSKDNSSSSLMSGPSSSGWLNIDRSNAHVMDVTVNGLTVIITEFVQKKPEMYLKADQPSNNDSTEAVPFVCILNCGKSYSSNSNSDN